MAVPDVMGVSEIAERLGVTKKRADQLVKEKGFPDGRRLKMGTVWFTEDVEAWIARYRPQLNEPGQLED